MEMITFVIPCYRSEKTIEKVVCEIINTESGKKQGETGSCARRICSCEGTVYCEFG